jgi:3-keto-disaccharide hydrolase
MKTFHLSSRASAMALALSSVFFSGLAAESNRLTDSEKAAGWKLLFDGKTTQGWRGYKKPGFPEKGWKVEDSILKKIAGERGGDIITDERFDDFELTWEWRIGAKGNNGLKYLVSEDRSSAPGHEYQMIDDKGNPDAANGAKRLTASFYDVLPPSSDSLPKPAGEWNLSRIVVQGNHVEHWLNGKKVLEYELDSNAVKTAIGNSKFKSVSGFGTKIKGHIMLTDHGDECWFRNIKIRQLLAK